jgi:AraC-like DNA-binding protein
VDAIQKHIYIEDHSGYTFRFGDLTVNILNVTQVYPSDDWYVGEHSHTCYELHVIPGGEGFVNIEGHDLHVQGGQFYITAPYVKHTQRVLPTNPMSEYCLRWELLVPTDESPAGQEASDEYRILKKYFSRCYPHAFQDSHRIDQKFERIFAELDRPRAGSRLRVQAVLIDIMVDVLQSIDSYGGEMTLRNQKQDEEERRLNRILEFVQKEHHRPITAEEVSRLFFLCPRQINRLLRKRWNCTLGELVTQHRVQEAIRYLQQSAMSLEEIALRCGFSSRYYMYEVFRKQGHPTPGDIRRAIQ